MRRAAAIAGVGVALLAVAGLALWLALPRLIESQATARLEALGLSPVSLSVREIGLRHITVEDLRLTPSLRADRLTARFDPLALSLESVTLHGVNATLDAQDGTLRANGLETVLAGEDAGQAAPPTPETPFTLPLDRVEVRDLSVTLTAPDATFILRGDTTFRQTSDGIAVTGALNGKGAGLTLAADVNILLRQPLPWGLGGEASLTLSAADGRLPGLASGLDGSLDAALSATDGAAHLTLAPGSRLTVAALAPALADLLPPAAQTALPLPWTLLSSDGVDVSAQPLKDTAGLRVNGRGTVTVEGARGRIILDAVGGTDILGGQAIRNLALDTFSVEATDLTVDGTMWSAFASLSGLTGIPLNAKAANARFVAEAHDLTLGTASAPRVALSLDGPLTWSGFSLLFDVRDGLIDLDGPVTAGDIRLPNGLEWPLAASGEAPGLELSLAPDGGITLVPRLTVKQPALRVNADGTIIDAAFDSGQVEGVVPIPDSPALRLETLLHGGTVSAAGTSLDAVTATLRVAPEGSSLDASASIQRFPGEPEDLTRQARAVRPFRLALNAGTDSDRRTVQFTASAKDSQGRTMAEAQGRHDLTDGTGQARVRMPERAYTATGVQPADYYAVIGTTGGQITGTLGAGGSLAWSPKGLSPRIDVLLKDVVVTRGFLTLDRINGVIRLTRFWPPRTPPDQTLAVAAINAGLPLTDALAIFQIPGDGTVALKDLSMHLAGGSVRADPATLPLDASSGALTLHVDGMRLGELINLVDLAGLAATGTLSGTIPVHLESGNVIVDNGRLTAIDLGSIQYQPAEPPAGLASGGQSTQLLLQALENFRYQALSLTLNGSAAGEMGVSLRLQGANPDLYDGYPVDFTLTVSGALSQIISDSMRGYQVPDRIQERIQNFGGNR